MPILVPLPMFKKFLSGYFTFTRKERRGIIVLLAAIFCFALLPLFYPFFISHRPQDHTAFGKDIAKLKIKQADSAGTRNYPENGFGRYTPYTKKNYPTKLPVGELFFFDPNTLDAAGWKRLGIREKTVSTIGHYLAKGGKFKSPGDISKIWGLHEDEVNRLLPFVRIRAEAGIDLSARKIIDHRPDPAPKYLTKSVDINVADTAAFIALPGIGSKLANRIVKFRDKLGGFYSPDQVGETFALPDSTFHKIRSKLILSDPTVKKININTAGLEELKSHPYIRYNLANAIVQYRQQHGKFGDIGDIKKIMTMTDDLYNKLWPYLSVQ